MIFNKSMKLFAISVLSLAVCVQPRSLAVSQIGDIRIEKTDDKWLCDKIECPPNAHRCFVSKSNENPSVLERRNVCFSEDNQILVEKNFTSATDPNYVIRQYITSYHSGGVYSTDNSSSRDFDEAAFGEQMQTMQTNLNNMMRNLNENLSNMQYRLAHMFDKK